MKDAFNIHGDVKFIDGHFYYRGNKYLLETYNDSEGNIIQIKLDVEIGSAYLRHQIQTSAEEFSQTLSDGKTLADYAALRFIQPGGVGEVLTYKGAQHLVPDLWGGVIQILRKEYNVIDVEPVPSQVVGKPVFKVVEGGMA